MYAKQNSDIVEMVQHILYNSTLHTKSLWKVCQCQRNADGTWLGKLYNYTVKWKETPTMLNTGTCTMCYNLVEIDHQKYLKPAVTGTCTNSCIHPKRLKKITTCSHFSLQMIRVWNSAGGPLNVVEAQTVNSIITKLGMFVHLEFVHWFHQFQEGLQ